MCLLTHFVLKNIYMYLLGTANIMFLSFIRFELLSEIEHGNPISFNMGNIILWLFC